MTFAAAFTLAVVVAALVLLAVEWLAPDLVLLGALGVVTAAGVIDLDRALTGFADPTLLAIGSLFVVAAGLRATGVLRKAAGLLLGTSAHRNLRTVLARLGSAAAVSSAFLNNTPIVAMGVPAITAWTRERKIAPSRLLMPLSFASILGGISTLIGTSTNLVADGLLRDAGHRGLGFFELGAVGVPLAVVGILYLVFVAPRLLPDRPPLGPAGGGLGGRVHLYRVPDGSLALGRTVAEAGLGTPELQLVRLIRDGGQVVEVAPERTVREGDRLTFRGEPNVMAETASRLGLEPVEIPDHEEMGQPRNLREVVVPQGSVLTESRVGGINFPDRYGAVVLGVVRGGRQLDRIESVVLRPGDSLFLATTDGFGDAYADSRDFYLIGGAEVEPEGLADVPVWRATKAKAGAAILVGIVTLAATGVLHISVAALLGALVMVALGFLSPAEARRSIDWSVLLVIGAAIGLGSALRESGAAEMVSAGIVSLGEPLGPRGILAALLVASTIFTLVITNSAAVAILFPVAMSVADVQGLDARPFVVGVTVAASLAFATPVGYQTNLMVYGPGGYRFSDFVRAGTPLQIVTLVLAVALIPLAWPF